VKSDNPNGGKDMVMNTKVKKKIVTVALAGVIAGTGFVGAIPGVYAETTSNIGVGNEVKETDIIDMDISDAYGWNIFYPEPTVTYNKNTDVFNVTSYLSGLNPGGHKTKYAITAKLNTGESIEIYSAGHGNTGDGTKIEFSFTLPSDLHKSNIDCLEYTYESIDDLWGNKLNGYAKISSLEIFGNNILNNGNFSLGSEGWTIYNDYGKLPAYVTNDNGVSAAYIYGSDTDNTPAFSQVLDVEPNTTYKVNFNSRSDSDGRVTHIYASSLSGDGLGILGDIYFTNSSKYEKGEFTFTTGPQTKKLYFHMENRTKYSSPVWITNIYVKKKY